MIMLTEVFNSLDYLVRLASLGTAGVSILAIFMIGRELFDLPNDTSSTKAFLIKKYMRMCTIIAIICAISGIANAYFNKEKVEKAENNYHELANIYTEQIQKLKEEKAVVSSTLDSIQTYLSTSTEPIIPSIQSSFERARYQLERMQLMPRDSVVRTRSLNSFPENHSN